MNKFRVGPMAILTFSCMSTISIKLSCDSAVLNNVLAFTSKVHTMAISTK